MYEPARAGGPVPPAPISRPHLPKPSSTAPAREPSPGDPEVITEAFTSMPVPSPPLRRDKAKAPEVPFLLVGEGLDEYARSLSRAVDLVQERLRSAERPFTGISPSELAAAFVEVDLDAPCDHLEAALSELHELYLRDAVFFHHPRYVAHLNCPVALPALVAEVILSAVNSSLDTWDQSVGGTLVEQRLIDWTAARIGLGDAADGIFTSGGTQSNLMALLLARDVCCARELGVADVARRGLPADFGRLRILASEVSHFSVQKAAALLGLGHDAVIPVACDERFRMGTAALQRTIRSCRTGGLVPMAVVATAGTTDFGSIDPLSEIARVCRAHGIWMHVDAAYGCGLLVSRRRRHLLEGIEEADSVTADFHKSFFQPVSCGALLVRDRRHLGRVAYHAEYLNPLSQRREGTPNLVDKSLQTTRRFDALKLWLTLRSVGPDAVGEAFDRAVDLAREAHLLVHHDERMEALHRPELGTLVFRYVPEPERPPEAVDALNLHIRKAIARSGEALLAGTRVHGRRCLKFTLLNPATTVADLHAVLDLVRRHGAHPTPLEAT